MYNRILVPLDGSPLAEQVLPYVRLLAKSLGVPVELLRVMESMPERVKSSATGIDPEVGGLSTIEGVLEEYQESRHADAQSYLLGLQASLKEAGVQATFTMVDGDPVHLVAEATNNPPDALVAMASHGRSGLSRWVFGSVMDRVLHETSNPLLVVRAQDQPPEESAAEIKTLIVPADGSAVAEQVFPHAVALAKALSLNIILVRSIPDFPYMARLTMYMPQAGAELFESLDSDAKPYLEQAKEELLRQGVSDVTGLVVRGDPGGKIVDIALETPGHLVALTTHGHSGVGRWLLGSVADRVIRHSSGPVLVIRAE